MVKQSVMASATQSYTINGVKVQFPHKPYPSQLSMMDKIIKGLNRKQNCLLESPTGSGKSLALLCSALAWQQSEQEKAKIENKEFMDKVGSACTCHCGKDSKCDSGDQPFMGLTSAYQIPPLPVNQTVTITTDKYCSGVDNDMEDFKLDPRYGNTFANLPQGLGNSLVAPEENISLYGGEATKWSSGEHSTEGCTCHTDVVEKPHRKIPKIYFGTRTHKQIAQIVRELGKTAYSDARMTILSSREHSCIHPQVSKMSGKNEECKNLLDGPGCRFFDNVRRKVSHASLRLHGLGSAWDLEDFKGFCRNAKACSYFGGRQLKSDAEVVFCPYNYLIDPNIRESLEIYLKEQIVILDEAHNIEDASREAASNSVSQKEVSEGVTDLNRMIEEDIKVNEHRAIRDMLTGLYSLIETHRHSTVSDGFDSAYKMWTGIEMVAQLTNCGIGPDRFEALKKCFASISEVEDSEQQRRIESLIKLKASTLKTVGGLFTVLDFIYRENMRYRDDYRVALVKSMVYVNTATEGRWLNKRRRPRQMEWTFSLNFWCLNPAVAFSDFGECCRSIILTSGTLSPMQSFQSELGVPFPIQLEASHVIGKSQVWVGCISKGPRGTPLLGNYQNAETFAYQDDIGALVYEVCSTVPHGVLCFVSSYKAIDKLTDRWKSTGLYDQIQEHKMIMVEPKASAKVDFDEVIQNYYQVIEEYEDAEVGGITGAFFLAVCRGKVSEGLDFADNNARAVITVGIPFPNVKDPQVDLKKQYNNQHSATRGLLRGSDWYEIQAYRALNQALGRCIRHRNDWGALIIVDERFGKNPQKYTKGLSKWVRQKVQQFYAFSAAKSSLTQFTQERLKNPTTTDVSVLNVSAMPQSPVPPKQSAIPQSSIPYSSISNGHITALSCQESTISVPPNNPENHTLQPLGAVQNGTAHFVMQYPQRFPGTVADEVVVVADNLSPSLSKGQLNNHHSATNSTMMQGGGFIIPEPVSVVPNAIADQPMQNHSNIWSHNVAAAVVLPNASEKQPAQNYTVVNPILIAPHTVSNAFGEPDVQKDSKVVNNLLQTQNDIVSKSVISGDGVDNDVDDLEGHIDLTDEDFEFNPCMASTQMPRKGRKSAELRSKKSEKSLQRRSGSLLKSNVFDTPEADGKESMQNNANGTSGTYQKEVKEKLSFVSSEQGERSNNDKENMKKSLISSEHKTFEGYNAKVGSDKKQLESAKISKSNNAAGVSIENVEIKQEVMLQSKFDIKPYKTLANGGCVARGDVVKLEAGAKKEGIKLESKSRVKGSESRSDSPDMFDSEDEAMSCDTDLEKVILDVKTELSSSGSKEVVGDEQVLCNGVKQATNNADIPNRGEQNKDETTGVKDTEEDVQEYLLRGKKQRRVDGQVSVQGKAEMADNENLQGNNKTADHTEMKEGSSVQNDRLAGGRRSLSLGRTRKMVDATEDFDGDVNRNEKDLKEKPVQKGVVDEDGNNSNGNVNQAEEAETLVTKRGSRTKKRRHLGEGGGNRHKKLKTKGVDFLDNLETENPMTYYRVKCKACGKDICPKVKDFSTVSTLPPYIKKVCNNSAVILVNPTNLISVPPKCTNLELKMRDGIYINSYWSDSDHCCYKFLFCRCSGKTLALEVKCLGQKPHTLLQEGQIWIFKELTDVSTFSEDAQQNNDS